MKDIETKDVPEIPGGIAPGRDRCIPPVGPPLVDYPPYPIGPIPIPVPDPVIDRPSPEFQ
jgi:hypothetical protein